MHADPNTTEPLTPYERGEIAAEEGRPGPPFPTPDSSWSERLYARGWSDTMEAMQNGK